VTESERRHALAEIRDRLRELAALQMSSARDVTKIRLRVEALAENLQVKWEELEEVRSEIERLLAET
jgi:hypothetical protein